MAAPSYYFDYNATRPLATAVLDLLRNPPWGNPASLHTLGRQAAEIVEQCRAFLLQTLKLSSTHQIIFHSGATEGLNSLILGRLHHLAAAPGLNTPSPYLILGGGDHRAIYDLQRNTFLPMAADHVISLSLGPQGEFNLAQAQEIMARLNGPAVLTYTAVNSETGVLWDLKDAATLKQNWGDKITIVVDATQLPGKTAWPTFPPEIEGYVFSGHKMGALPGSGFSAIRQDLAWDVFLTGAGQQAGKRGGTENVLGALALQRALEDVLSFDLPQALAARKTIEQALAASYPASRGPWQLIAAHAPRAVNTISFLDTDPNFLWAYWNQHHIYTSLGPACSAALAAPSPSLLQMGYSAKVAAQLVRLSFPPLTTALANEYAQVLTRTWPPV
ncbi:MAG: aminotransferase class V-fold PLP-dependent enzyme [Bacteriovoracaceae bacterium]|nr:aminotransferase class V-fold PLP-dependent enzyme [Bacteriovoracaceae bacterium]